MSPDPMSPDPMSPDPMSTDDARLAMQVAEQAGAFLVELRHRLGFADPDRLRHAGDRGAHELITRELTRLRPADAVLSEEGRRDDPARMSAARVWIVDPLDGTREFGEPGRVDWAVHVALWSAGSSAPAGLSAAAVSLPAQGVVLGTVPQERGTVAAPRGTSNTGRPLRFVVSRSRAPWFLTGVAEALQAQLVPLGSAGAKAAEVITGAADAYLHAGGQYEWDSAAPVAVAAAAGLHASRLDGAPLRYNQADPRVPDLLICHRELAGPLLAALAAQSGRLDAG